MPSSMVAAVACSAAAGKNPWLPLALIFLLAAPSSVPAVMMDPTLHRGLHGLGPPGLLWSLGGVFLALAIADSLADKVGFIEKWLVPVSTAWRPFAGIAAAALLGVAASGDDEPTGAAIARADLALLLGGSAVALTVVLGAFASWIATMGKTAVRLLMSLVPVPGLRLAHSFVDDLFALAASVAGLAFGHTALVAALAIVYLAIGVFTGPLLTRLTWIHVRIGWSLLRKGWRMAGRERAAVPGLPRWAERFLAAEGLAGASALPAYVYRAPSVGRCRAGHLVLAPGRVLFLTRVAWQPRALAIDHRALARVALAETATSRTVTLVERLESGALREVHVHLFAARAEDVHAALDAGAERAGLVRVRADSESARRGLPGYADRESSVRFRPPAEAGSLRLQGLVTLAAAVGVGALTGGVFVPIGAGYLFSPFRRRFVAGMVIAGYLSLCIIASMGFGWPAAVLYAIVLNALALRDLTRNALKARVDGYVDRRAFLPAVASRVWDGSARLASPADRSAEGDEELLTDGPWRAVALLIARAPEAERAPAAA